MRRCVRCVQTDSYPGLTFDESGVCSICLAFDRRWGTREVSEKEETLVALLDKARRRNPRYQAVVGLSGGKDSSYALHLMVKRYKANVLALTYDNGFLADGARKNIELLVEQLGVEHRYMRMEPELWKKTYHALVKNRCTDLCMVCMNGGLAALNQLTLKERIPMVVWGLSPRTEPIFAPDVVCMMDYRYLRSATKPYLKRSEAGHLRYADLPWVFYAMVIRRIRHIMLPEYVAWREDEISAFLSNEYGWVDYGHGKHHFDCMVNPAMDYFMHRRIGLTKVSEILSQMVRSRQLAREEALKRLEVQDMVEEPTDSVETFCTRVGLSRAEIQPFIDGETLDYRHFRTYTSLLQRVNWLFWLTFKMGITSETLYDKYRR